MSTMGYVSTLTGADETASLNLDFKNQKYKVDGVTKQFSDLITFTRASGGGRFNAAGQYEWLANDQPRFDYDPITKVLKGILIEEARTNLATYSNDLGNAIWPKLATTINSSSTISPEGLMNADVVVENTAATNHGFYRDLTVASGTSYTVSFFVKAVGRNRVRLRLGQAGGINGTIIGDANFDLDTTSFISGSGSSPTITDIGNGWKRISVTAVAASTTLGVTVLCIDTGTNVSYTGTGASALAFFGMSVEGGAFATSYIPTPSIFTSRASTGTYFDSNGVLQTAAINIPRIDYEPVSKVSRGLLVENAATNLLPYSTQIDTLGGWTRVAAILTLGGMAPDGTSTAWNLVEDSSANKHEVLRSITPVAGTTYTVSVFLKKSGRKYGFLSYYGTGSATALIDLDTGAIVQTWVATPSVNHVVRSVDVGNGWYRVSVTGTAPDTIPLYLIAGGSDTTTPALVNNRPTYTGNGQPSIKLWGAQLEVGAFPTSYIPTTPTFTSRASTATYFDVNGVMQTAATNVARSDAYMRDEVGVNHPIGLLLEGAATNLCTRSNEYTSASWIKGTGVALSTDGTLAPDGSFAQKFTLAGSVSHHIAIPITALAVGTTYTLSVWLKPIGSTVPAFQLAYYDSGVSVVGGEATGQVVGTWRRYSFTFTPGVTPAAPQVRLIGYSGGVDGNSFYLFNTQLEVGSYATSDIINGATFTSRASTATYLDSAGVMKTAAINEARSSAYGYDSTGVLKPIGLLLEGAGTNMAIQSNSATTLTPTRATYVDTGQLFIDGLTPWRLLREDTTISNSHFAQPATRILTANTAYTASYFVKAAGRTKFRLEAISAANWLPSSPAIVYDMVAMTATTTAGGATTTGTIQRVSPDIFRVTWTATTGVADFSSAAYPVLLGEGGNSTYSGDGISGIYISGYQLEAGTVATSYIPTTTVAVTRSADVSTSAQVTRAADVSSSVATTRAADVTSSAQVTRAYDLSLVNTLTPWYNQTQGTLFAEGSSFSVSTVQGKFFAQLGDVANDRLGVSLTSTNQPNGFALAGGAVQFDLKTASIGVGPTVKQAVAWGSGSASFTSQGATTLVDATVTVPVVSSMRLGSYIANANPLNGYLQAVRYYPIRLSNAEIQALTI